MTSTTLCPCRTVYAEEPTGQERPSSHRHAEDIAHQQMPRRDIRVGVHQGAHAHAELAGDQVEAVAALHPVGFAARRACAGVRLQRRLVDPARFPSWSR